jgi:hypothetical protein
VRFMLSQQELGEALRKFQFDWEEGKISWNGPEPTTTQAKAMITSCKSLCYESTPLFGKRPTFGLAEFQNVVALVDQSAKAAEQMKEPGA